MNGKKFLTLVAVSVVASLLTAGIKGAMQKQKADF